MIKFLKDIATWIAVGIIAMINCVGLIFSTIFIMAVTIYENIKYKREK